jgi:hypothetical protein
MSAMSEEHSRAAAARARQLLLAAALLAVAPLAACGGAPASQAARAGPPAAAPAPHLREEAQGDVRRPRLRLVTQRCDPSLDDLQARTFRYFWELTNPANGLVPDRWPTPSFCSVAAIGFGLTAIPIGVQRGWITRAEGTARVRTTLEFLLTAPQGPQPTGTIGYRGFFYHFLDMSTGARFQQVELSTIDTALLMAGVLTSQAYFDNDDSVESAIRSTAEELYRRVDWAWACPRPPLITLGWLPERGFDPNDWRGYDEAMILYILALGSPTHPVKAEAWQAWTSTYVWTDWYGEEHVDFPPLFGHQFSHIWVDFRGIQDDFMRTRRIDYFENSRRAVLSQRAYAIANPEGWAGYGDDIWGVTACDGPADVTLEYNSVPRVFHTYAGRGVGARFRIDDGTIAPMGAAASIPFAPEVAIPAVKTMRQRYGEWLYSTYGFVDAFNLTFTFDVNPAMGRIVPGVGWFDTDYLGIDQGPIVAMLENYRTGLIWALMRKSPYIVDGLRRAGFSGGWLDETP